MSLQRKLKVNKKIKVYDDVSDDTAELLDTILSEVEEVDDKDLKSLWLDTLQTFSRTGDVNALLDACSLRRKPVDIDTFLFDPFYLGMDEHFVYPSVLRACHDLDSDKYVESVLKGAIGTGKSTIANVMIARAIYKLSCMRSPQTTFGVQPKSSLVFTIQSVRFNTAKKAVFEEFGQYISSSPFFSKIYPYDKKIQSQMLFKQQRVSLLPVSSSHTGAISMNVIGGILDEMNFMQKVTKSKSAEADLDGNFDQAKKLYNTLARRRRSRFTKQGKLPGMLFCISSTRFPDDFTEVKARESKMLGGPDASIYVYHESQWSAKPRDTFLKEEFKVQIGNDRHRSRILNEVEEPAPGCETIMVPADFKQEFMKDIDGSLRDYAGITSRATRPFITDRSSISKCVEAWRAAGYKPLLSQEEIDISVGIPVIRKDSIKSELSNVMRVVHLDLGLNKDACGFAMGHIAGTKVVEKRNPETNAVEFEILPMVAIDLALRIVPPRGGEILFSNIRTFIAKLRDEYHFPIEYVTFDGFQSADSRQILRTLGFNTDYLSVDRKIDNYRSLRDALYDTRVLLQDHHYLIKELSELEHVTSKDKEKADHRPSGSKDVADAVCGVVSFLLKRRSAWSGITRDRRVGPDTIGIKKEPSEDGADMQLISSRPSMSRRTIGRRDISRRNL